MRCVPATTPSADPPGQRDIATDEATIAGLMSDIAAGRRSAIWQLHRLADIPVRSRVRGELRRLGVRYDADDLDALVLDAMIAIADIAAGWRPGGAPPWAWAHHRVVGVVHRWVGTFADSLDGLGGGDPDGVLGWYDARRGTSRPGVDERGSAVDPVDAVAETRAGLRRLAATTPLAAALDAALSALVSPLAAAVWLAVVEEAEAGSHHPAVTVGARFGMRPDAVRKTVQRVRQRLADASGDERFAALASLPVIAGCRPVAA